VEALVKGTGWELSGRADGEAFRSLLASMLERRHRASCCGSSSHAGFKSSLGKLTRLCFSVVRTNNHDDTQVTEHWRRILSAVDLHAAPSCPCFSLTMDLDGSVIASPGPFLRPFDPHPTVTRDTHVLVSPVARILYGP
jgi:hypothetical protein